MFPPRRPCPAGGPRLAFCSVVRDERVGAAPGRLVAVGISGSPSATSKSRVLVEHALAQLEARGAAVRLIDVATPPAAELRAAVDRAVREAVALASAGSD